MPWPSRPNITASGRRNECQRPMVYANSIPPAIRNTDQPWSRTSSTVWLSRVGALSLQIRHEQPSIVTSGPYRTLATGQRQGDDGGPRGWYMCAPLDTRCVSVNIDNHHCLSGGPMTLVLA